jgi:hypothetical protein
VKSEPPVPLIEIRDRCRVNESELMKLDQCVRDLVIAPIDGANLVHKAAPSGFSPPGIM